MAPALQNIIRALEVVDATTVAKPLGTQGRREARKLTACEFSGIFYYFNVQGTIDGTISSTRHVLPHGNHHLRIPPRRTL